MLDYVFLEMYNVFKANKEVRKIKTVRLENLETGKPIPKDVTIDKSEDIKEECRFGCPRDSSFELMSKLLCRSADDSYHSLTISIIAIILSAISIILHFA